MAMDTETVPLKNPQNLTTQKPTIDSHPQNPTIKSQPPNSDDIKSCLHCCAVLIGSAFAVWFSMYLLLFKLIPFLFFSPYAYHPEFHVHSLKLSALKISDKEIHGNFSLTLAADNPRGGINIYYNAPKFSIFFDKDYILLAKAKTTSFEQQAGELALMQVDLAASLANEAMVAHSLNYDVTWRRKAKFRVEVEDELTVTPGSSADKKNISLTVSCQVRMEFDSDGKSGQNTGENWCSVI